MEKRHTGIGIASFTLSIIISIALFALIVVAAVVESQSPEGMNEESTPAILIGLGVFAALLFQFIAFCLGIAGCCQKNSKKVFPILGMVFSACSIFGLIGLMVLGMALGGR